MYKQNLELVNWKQTMIYYIQYMDGTD